MDFLNQDLSELQKQSDDLKKQKQMVQLAGILGDALGSSPSFGEVYLGRNNPKTNYSGAANAIANSMEDPLERQKTLLTSYRAQKEAKKEAGMDDVDSAESKALYAGFKQAGINLKDGMTASQITAGYGKPADFMLAKYKEGEQRKTELAKLDKKVPKGYMNRVNPETGLDETVPMLGSLKQNQYQAAAFGTRAQDADRTLSKLMEDGFDPSSKATGFQETEIPIPFTHSAIGLPERLKTEDVKKYQQAKKDFILAKLRKESGATIRPEEEESEAKAFFPQPGDTKDVLLQKAKARQIAVSALKAEAGGAMNEVANQRLNTPVGAVEAKFDAGPATHVASQESGQKRVPSREEAIAEIKRRRSMTAMGNQSR